jgi:hypothetical protein
MEQQVKTKVGRLTDFVAEIRKDLEEEIISYDYDIRYATSESVKEYVEEQKERTKNLIRKIEKFEEKEKEKTCDYEKWLTDKINESQKKSLEALEVSDIIEHLQREQEGGIYAKALKQYMIMNSGANDVQRK